VKAQIKSTKVQFWIYNSVIFIYNYYASLTTYMVSAPRLSRPLHPLFAHFLYLYDYIECSELTWSCLMDGRVRPRSSESCSYWTLQTNVSWCSEQRCHGPRFVTYIKLIDTCGSLPHLRNHEPSERFITISNTIQFNSTVLIF